MPWLTDALLVALVVGVAATVLSGLVHAIRSRGRRTPFGPPALDGAIVGSLAAVVVATLSPLAHFPTWAGRPVVQLTPLERLDGAPVEFAVINLLLLVPTIFLLALRWRRAGVVTLTVVGAGLSVAIEFAQLLHPSRGTNVDDVILNTAGAAAAAAVGVSVRWLLRRRDRLRVEDRSALEAEVSSPLQPTR